jgi:hypothetical protein
MKIAVGLIDFLDPQPQPNTHTTNTEQVQRKRSREESRPGPSQVAIRRESLTFERRDEYRSRTAYTCYPGEFRPGRGWGAAEVAAATTE